MITMAAPDMRPTMRAARGRVRSSAPAPKRVRRPPLYDEHLSALPGMQRLTSTLAMKGVVVDRPLPLLAR
jgi:hypothetical protein